MNALRRWGWSALIGFNQFAGVFLSPIMFYRVHNPDEKISSRLGKLKRSHGYQIPWKYPLARVVEAGLDLLEPGHCIDAIEEDEA